MILFALSFVAGVLTVLAPCVLPLLPVIVGSSVSGETSKKKAFVISLSLGVSIIIFTLLLKVSSLLISIPQEVWSVFSGLIIIAFGFTSLVPGLWESLPFVSKLNVSSNKLLADGYKKESLWGNIIIGLALGPVFSSCSPTYFVILATVLPQSFFLGLVDLIVYAIGLSGALFLISILGQRIMSRVSGISETGSVFRKVLGFIFIILGLVIVFGIDKKIERNLLTSGLFDITRVEQSLLKINDSKPIITTKSSLQENTVNKNTPTKTEEKVIEKTHGPKAPEIINPSGYINTDGKPITIGEFKGKKVVLLDVWTYSCINCQRTLPYVESWYEKYKDKGLVVIGLHTPEFAFEKIQKNVESAVKGFNLTYPVVLDNDYSTWTAYGNQYWPRKYLINEDGEIIYDHIGEGNYEETEMAIQKALSELNNKDVIVPISAPKNVISVDSGKVSSPEVYFGSNRNEYLGNGKRGLSGPQSLILPMMLSANTLYLNGTWNFSGEFVSSQTAGKIVFKYSAKNVYMVASSDTGVSVTVLKDGVKEKTLFISGNKLYTLISGDSYGVHTLEVDVPAGLDAFTLTFG